MQGTACEWNCNRRTFLCIAVFIVSYPCAYTRTDCWWARGRALGVGRLGLAAPADAQPDAAEQAVACRMRRAKGGRGVHAVRHQTRPPFWETDKSQINPPTGGAEVGAAAEGSATVGSVVSGDGGSVGGSNAIGGGGAVAQGGDSSAPRPQQSPTEPWRRDGRYSHKERGADLAPADQRREQIGRTPPPTNSRGVGLQGQRFSPSRMQMPTCALLLPYRNTAVACDSVDASDSAVA